MQTKKKTQFFITFSAILIGLVHLIFPDIKIDAIILTLIIIAIIPWLEPLFKSVELPGGLKVEFKDFEKIEQKAKEAGLIQENVEFSASNKNQINNDTYSFVEIAEKNQELALVSFRIEIEKRLRKLAEKYSIESIKYSIVKLIEALSQNDILSLSEKTTLRDMIQTLNQAVHGLEYDQRAASWVIENGPKILQSLDEKLKIRSGRITVSPDEKDEHWIDASFNQCKKDTTIEWHDCIKTHTELWNKELNKIYKSLFKKLQSPQKEKLKETQDNWRRQLELEKKFLYSFEDLNSKIGTGGIAISSQGFMYKVRERTLELEEVLNFLV
ncbi:MAG: DUF1311 domain-containing protein [Calditrichaceae bacterium]|nr:DUF1311 domain-containing protein [Calditrichaceae bacterium]MBN2708568.1 DUF1311 domain-containing protein [Calditrichaceae bacterium]RQV96877.1 MAG: DUF1311 domain-containing protein [Calditrichota bacterium]